MENVILPSKICYLKVVDVVPNLADFVLRIGFQD